MDGMPTPPHRLVEFLNAISRCDDVVSAISLAAELVAEEFDAEVGAVLVDGRLAMAVGFGQAGPPDEALTRVAPGIGEATLGPLGACATLAAPWAAGTQGMLVVARSDGSFSPADRNLVMGMAGSLGLVLDMLGVLERERGRQVVLQMMLDVQRAISHREPLHVVLNAVTDGASRVLHGLEVCLVLAHAVEPDRPIVVGPAIGPGDDVAEVPVHVHGTPVGVLRARVPHGARVDAEGLALLTSFAEHASLALAEARTLEVIEEAFRDPLTGTPNRQLFMERLAHELALSGAEPGGPAVLFIDLDRFKAVNDTLGHAAGDELLRAVSERIRGCVRDGTVARFGGDEFAVLLENVRDPLDAAAVGERIVAEIQRAFTISGRTVHVGATVGIAYVDPDLPLPDAEELVRNADAAMYRGKGLHGSRVVTYEPQLHAALLERLELQADLQLALERGELRLHFQPVVALPDGAVLALEALLRWEHPALGMVPPGEFISLAEVTGAIVPIGRWVLQEGCRWLARWRRAFPGLHLCVNVSGYQLREAGFVDDVRHVLVETGLPGSSLLLEITESALLDDEVETVERLEALRGLGCEIGLDDFGTGFSSLGYLRRYPVDALKIDRSFVSGSGSGAGGDQLARTILELGRAYELEVVAEGIETQEQCDRLVGLGCRFGQGWLFGRPVPGDDVPGVLARSPVTAPAAGVGSRGEVPQPRVR